MTRSTPLKRSFALFKLRSNAERLYTVTDPLKVV
ncbi:hypothetical protein BC937DRAFT_94384 [Endogone sp. FLAS-F59071]|nr:hypothetical protein BC937DRAFT_94384 [Endogone sp. FLAS-F59071]|eukprot:RUS14079.1 hypothetical protein BC937DRAFT_94384 [Endogone sp. FLAS-F59071]